MCDFCDDPTRALAPPKSTPYSGPYPLPLLGSIWKVTVHAMRDKVEERAQDAKTPRDPAESTAALSRRVKEPLRELGRMEGRLELTATTESTLRESLKREKQRADEERRRADAERERAEEIRGKLEEMRSRGFWRRLFGG
jgi:hypothetical protein